MSGRTIFYVSENTRDYRSTHEVLSSSIDGYEGMFYHDVVGRVMPGPVIAGVGMREIEAVLEKHGSSIDMILVDSIANGDLLLAQRLEENPHYNGLVVVSPIEAMPGVPQVGRGEYSGLHDPDVTYGGADFGIQIPLVGEELIAAFEAVFERRVDVKGVYFNANKYDLVDGVAVPKKDAA
tara:strand:- start:7186 stop:7725 length:540 start_codon:yes stop_codon:yes gene_type:complete